MLLLHNSRPYYSWRTLLVICAGAYALITPIIRTAHANENQTLEVQGVRLSPFIFEHTLQKGEDFTGEVDLTNTTNQPIQLSLEVHDFIPAGRHGEVRFLPSNQTTNLHFSLSEWIDIIKQPNYTLPPNATTRTVFRVTVPIEADDGTHYGGILFSFNGGTSTDGSKIVQSVGALLIMKVGNAQESGAVDNFITPKKVYTEPTVSFSTTFTNTGSSHTSPKGKIEITNAFGSLIGLAYVNENAQISLPSTSRDFESRYLGRNMFGQYSANLILTYGNPKLEIRKTITFWVIPWKTIIKTGVFSLLIIFILYRCILSYNRRIIKNAKLNQ